jgi:putative NADPH-quinone reductase
MKVLIIDCFPADNGDGKLVQTALATLRSNGHEISHQRLVGGPFEAFMTADERTAYHSDIPLITPEAITAAAELKSSQGVLFCYPTTLFTLPPVLKSYIERVFVPGVSFVLDAKNRVRPGLTHVRRLGVITITAHDAATTRRTRDAGRRSILWGPRLVCHPLARRTFVSIPAGKPDSAAVQRALKRW